MAKNRNNQNRSDFDKFNGSKLAQTVTAMVDDQPVVVPVDDDDSSDVDEPTDPVSADEMAQSLVTRPLVDTITVDSLGRGAVPIGAYQKLNQEAMKAQTILEQEEILARLHPKYNNLQDPADNYKRCLVSGRSLPEFKVRADADPLLVKSKDVFERLIAGGLILPSAYSVYNVVVDHLIELLVNLAEKPNAESGQGSAGGNSEVGSGAS